jgi:hypothetical protein
LNGALSGILIYGKIRKLPTLQPTLTTYYIEKYHQFVGVVALLTVVVVLAAATAVAGGPAAPAVAGDPAHKTGCDEFGMLSFLKSKHTNHAK